MVTSRRIDRRSSPRIVVDGGEVRGRFGTQSEFVAFFASDISEGGMRIFADNGLPRGGQFHFRIEIADLPNPFEGLGEVQWTQTQPGSQLIEIGVRFLDLTPSTKVLVSRIVGLQSASRRRHERIEVADQNVRGEFVSLADFLEFFALNISEGGMKFSAQKPMPIGTTFHFRMALGKSDQPFEGLARVQWVMTEGAAGKVIHGAQFVSLTEASKRLVRLVVSANNRANTTSHST